MGSNNQLQTAQFSLICYECDCLNIFISQLKVCCYGSGSVENCIVRERKLVAALLLLAAKTEPRTIDNLFSTITP